MKSKISFIVLMSVIIFLTALAIFLGYQVGVKTKQINELKLKYETMNAVVASENSEGEIINEEPVYVTLDSNLAITMTDIVTPHSYEDYFYSFKGSKITLENLSDDAKLKLAYWNYAKDYVKEDANGNYSIEKKYIDEGIKKVFGDIEYKNTGFFVDARGYEYDEATQTFVQKTIGGGGGPMPHAVTGVYKVIEYSDRYEIYSKYLFLDSTYIALSDYVIWYVRAWDSYCAKLLATYKERGNDTMDSLEELVKGVSEKSFVNVQRVVPSENEMKLLSKYYDDAAEYKHTFMKNSDGTYYWSKSEILN